MTMKGKVREGEIANENFIGKYAISVELKREECEFISNRTEISEDKTEKDPSVEKAAGWWLEWENTKQK